MNERAFHRDLAIGYLACALVVFVVLFFISAGYGRHARSGWGPVMSERLGWVLMESASLIVFGTCLVVATRPISWGAGLLGALWLLHYVHRAFIYPFRMKMEGRTIPVLIPMLAILFNCGNAYLNGRWLYTLSPPEEPIVGLRYLAGVALFVAGFAINYRSDRILAELRKPGETGYQIPWGGLYRWISCPNYLGEIVEWIGFAVAAWSIPGLSFAVWTAANLVPRARAHHLWYRARFADYPPARKALFPGLW